MATFKMKAHTVPNQDGRTDADAIRCSFVTVVTPRAFQEGAVPKYSVVMMFDKANTTHMAEINRLKKELEACLVGQWPKDTARQGISVVANTPVFSKASIKDGDVAINEAGHRLTEENPEYAGHYVVRVSGRKEPHVVGKNGEAIDPKLCRSGFWYKVNVNAYAYTGGSGGVTVGLNGLQFIREDEVLGGGKPSADSMFGSVESGGDASQYAPDSTTPAQPAGGAADDLLGGPGTAAAADDLLGAGAGKPVASGDLLG